MSKLASLALSAAIVFSQTGVAFADNSAGNQNTGPGSNDSAVIEQTNSVDVSISNKASVKYNINFDLNTGNNTVSHNTTAGDLKSGDINATIDLNTDINQESGICDSCLPHFEGGDNTVSNEETGPKSDNEAKIKTRNNVDIDVHDDADVDYDVDLDANTGGNECSHNTTVGDCTSGDISVGLAINTDINQGGVGGANDANDEEESSEPTESTPVAGGVTVPEAGVGGGLFAAGSSLLLMLAMLFLAANAGYLLTRRSQFAFHFLNEGKVRKGRKR